MTRRDEPGTGESSGSAARPAAAVDVLVAALEEDVVLGRLHPRQRLVEDELIARFGASRHQVRQALTDLDRMGLVERVPNRGAQVRAYAVEEVEALYELRDLLEGTAAGLIDLPVTTADLGSLKALQAIHDEAVAAGDLPRIFRANHAFHRKLFGCCRNAFLAEAIDAAAQRAHGVRFMVLVGPAEREAARLQHHAMIAAIEACDRAALVLLCRAHLPPSKDAYLRTLGVDGRGRGDRPG